MSIVNLSMSDRVLRATTDSEKEELHNTDRFMVADMDGKCIYQHEAIWVLFNRKPIPTGFLVYHQDGNPMNNDPDNLDIVDSLDDLHLDNNKVFHQHNFVANREFILKHFDDIYAVLFPSA